MKMLSLAAFALSITLGSVYCAAFGSSADEKPSNETAAVTLVVQGMMKSQSGAT